MNFYEFMNLLCAVNFDLKLLCFAQSTGKCTEASFDLLKLILEFNENLNSCFVFDMKCSGLVLLSTVILVGFCHVFCVAFSDKRNSGLAAADGAGDSDGLHGLDVSDSVSLDSSVLLNAPGIDQSAQGETLESSALATNLVSAKAKQKSSRPKSAKSRPMCLVCNKSFHTRYKLNEHHAVVHLDKRLFSCNVCQKTFGRADHLIRHVRNRVCVPRQQLPELMDASSWRDDPG